jgi:transcriptional antiterminator RfaH
MTESLFPNYLFARFNFPTLFELVRYTEGVSSLINFGYHYPEVPESVIEELRENFEGNELALMDDSPQAGEPVTITTGAMFGLPGVVLRAMPAKQRVQVLVEMLGQMTMVELSMDSIMRESRPLPQGLVAVNSMAESKSGGLAKA